MAGWFYLIVNEQVLITPKLFIEPVILLLKFLLFIRAIFA